MMPDNLTSFAGASLRSVEQTDYSWFFSFGDGLAIGTESPWRLVTPDGIAVSSDDHGHQFGLPSPVDAADRVMSRLASHLVLAVSVDAKTGDLLVSFADKSHLQFLQMSCGYESWRVTTQHGESICLGGGKIAFLPAAKKSYPPDGMDSR